MQPRVVAQTSIVFYAAHTNVVSLFGSVHCSNLCAVPLLLDFRTDWRILSPFPETMVWWSSPYCSLFRNLQLSMVKRINDQKFSWALHSFKLFCMGVPVNIILRRLEILLTARLVVDFRFFMTCPSSHTTKSAPRTLNGFSSLFDDFHKQKDNILTRCQQIFVYWFLNSIHLDLRQFQFRFFCVKYKRTKCFIAN